MNEEKKLMMMSFRGDFNIHDLKERHPEIYKEIMQKKRWV